MYIGDIHDVKGNLYCADTQNAYRVDMRYDKPLMIRLSAHEHALLEDLIRKETNIISKAEMIRRLIERAAENTLEKK